MWKTRFASATVLYLSVWCCLQDKTSCCPSCFPSPYHPFTLLHTLFRTSCYTSFKPYPILLSWDISHYLFTYVSFYLTVYPMHRTMLPFWSALYELSALYRGRCIFLHAYAIPSYPYSWCIFTALWSEPVYSWSLLFGKSPQVGVLHLRLCHPIAWSTSAEPSSPLTNLATYIVRFSS